MERDNVRMVKFLQEHQLVIYHLFVALDIFLQDDLHGNLASRTVRFSNNTICPSTLSPWSDAIVNLTPERYVYQGTAHFVLCPNKPIVSVSAFSKVLRLELGYALLIISSGLAMQLVED